MTDAMSDPAHLHPETPNDDHGIPVIAVSHDDGLRVELARRELLTADQARRLAADLIAAADRIS